MRLRNVHRLGAGLVFAAAISPFAGGCQVISVVDRSDIEPESQCKQASECTDTPDDCLVPACEGGKCIERPQAEGTACANGGVVCDGAGSCVGCVNAAQCPDTAGDCTHAVCEGGSCGLAPTDEGTACSGPNGESLCDNAGTCVVCNADDECPNIVDDCKTPTCENHACSTSPVEAGTSCDQGGGHVCDDAGACVACNKPTDCPNNPESCKTPTCNEHICGDVNKPKGAACATASGDVCDATGSCVECNSSDECESGVCVAGVCPTAICVDGIKNADETDVDCGGSCPKCDDAKKCASNADCQSNVCTSLLCQPATCNDSVKNGSETGVDCGGSCSAKCGDGLACGLNSDCINGVCLANICQAATCVDGLQNGSEPDVDCGGPCPNKCDAGKGCGAPSDCVSDVCSAKICQETCFDGLKNADETDVDCGGSCLANCAVGKSCTVGGDCVDGVCGGNVCLAATCMDGAKNGPETDVDCGGGCPNKCVSGKGCGANADCVGNVCTTGVCQPTCSDGSKNGSETDVDCGGTCAAKCALGKSCSVTADCNNAVCVGGTCQLYPSCNALHTAAPGLTTGVYPLDLDGAGATPVRPFYCDMITDGGGWTMVYKVSAGVTGDPLTLWQGAGLNESNAALLTTLPSASHYVSSYIGSFWNQGGQTLTAVRTHVYNAPGALVLALKWNGAGSDSMNWFAKPNLLMSPYPDITGESQNSFSIPGEVTAARRFYINRDYAGCNGDTGWLVVDAAPDSCAWETALGNEVRIGYAPGAAYANWNDAGILKGAVFAVLVK